jgi:hypothetical protein
MILDRVSDSLSTACKIKPMISVLDLVFKLLHHLCNVCHDTGNTFADMVSVFLSSQLLETDEKTSYAFFEKDLTFSH